MSEMSEIPYRSSDGYYGIIGFAALTGRGKLHFHLA